MANVKRLKPNHSNVVVKILKNKYVKTQSDSGLILSSGLSFSQETGEIEKLLEEIIVLGVIVYAGPECKYYKVEEEVYMDSRSLRPIPFNGQGFFTTNEQNIICGVEDAD